VSGPGQSASQRTGQLDRLGRWCREPRPRLRREQPGGGGGGLPGQCELADDLGVRDLRRLANSPGSVHIDIQATPLEPVRLLRLRVQHAQDVDHLRRGHGGEPGRQAGLIERQRGDQQPSDLLQLMPFQHPAHRRLHPHAPGQHRQRDQAAGLAALLDRHRRHRVRPCRSARAGQRLGVAQKPLRIARRRHAARKELTSPRRLDSPKIHRVSVTRHLTRGSPPAPPLAPCLTPQGSWRGCETQL
jgi:hypothetical protein